MGWAKGNISKLDAAWGPKRYMLAPLFGAVVGFIDWGLARLSEVGVGALTFDDESPYVERTEYI